MKLPGTDKEARISQYADDITIFVGNEESVCSVLALVNAFSNVSGLQLNRDKTEALWIGSWKLKRKTVGNIRWTLGNDSRMKILGVIFFKQSICSAC